MRLAEPEKARWVTDGQPAGAGRACRGTRKGAVSVAVVCRRCVRRPSRRVEPCGYGAPTSRSDASARVSRTASVGQTSRTPVAASMS